MDFDFGSLMASFVVSGAGYVLFSYGRKMERAPHVVAGLVLLIAPYFVPGVLLTLLLGAGVFLLLWGALWYGL
jgi:hypothetical protein